MNKEVKEGLKKTWKHIRRALGFKLAIDNIPIVLPGVYIAEIDVSHYVTFPLAMQGPEVVNPEYLNTLTKNVVDAYDLIDQDIEPVLQTQLVNPGPQLDQLAYLHGLQPIISMEQEDLELTYLRHMDKLASKLNVTLPIDNISTGWSGYSGYVYTLYTPVITGTSYISGVSGYMGTVGFSGVSGCSGSSYYPAINTTDNNTKSNNDNEIIEDFQLREIYTSRRIRMPININL
jgi:hypothetical protein